MTSMAQSLFLSSMETVINRALPLDPVTEHKVKKLAGKTLAVHTTTPDIKATVIFSGDSIQIFGDFANTNVTPGIDGNHHNNEQPADAVIEAPALSLASQALRNDDHIIGSDIIISGDRELVQEIRNIVSSLDIDWEEPLSHFIGDVAAHQIGQIGRGFFR